MLGGIERGEGGSKEGGRGRAGKGARRGGCAHARASARVYSVCVRVSVYVRALTSTRTQTHTRPRTHRARTNRCGCARTLTCRGGRARARARTHTHTHTHTDTHTHTHETIAGAHRPDSAPRRPRFCARATARACWRCPDALEIRVGEEAEAGKAGALARARLAVDGEDDVVHAQLVRRVRQRPHLPA